MNDTELLEQVRQHWLLIRGAQFDMLNGRPDMSAMEEIAISARGLDELLLEKD